MRPTLKTFLLASGLLAFGLVLSLAAGMLWLDTDSGRAWLSEEIEARSAGALHIEELQGNPLNTWSAGLVRYDDADTRMQLRMLRIDWSPWELLSGRLHLRSVQADGMSLTLPKESSSGTAGTNLPTIVVQVDSLRLAGADIYEGSDAVASLSALTLEQFVFGRVLGGAYSLRYEGWHVHGKMQGKPRDWTALIAADDATDVHMGLNLQGSGKDKGRLKLEGGKAQSRIALSGTWSMQGDMLKSVGDITMQQGDLQHTGTWSTQVDTASGEAQGKLEAETSAALLSRNLHWSCSAHRDSNGGLHGDFAEPSSANGAPGLSLQWQWPVGEAFKAKGVLDHWRVPLKDAEGNLNGGVSAGYAAAGWGFDAAIRDGSMAGLHASLDVQAQGKGQQWSLQRGDLQMLGMQLRASGQGDATEVRLDGKFDSDNLHHLLALAGVDGSGRLHGGFKLKGKLKGKLEGKLNGDAFAPELVWNGEARGLSVDGGLIDALKASGSWNHVRREGGLKLSGSGLSWNDKRWNSLTLDARLDSEAVSFHGEASGDISAAWRIKGQRQADAWKGRLERLEVREASTLWLQLSDMPWRFAKDSLSIERSPLKLMGQNGWLAVDTGPQNVRASLEFASFSLQALNPWMQRPVLGMDGIAALQIKLGGTRENPLADVQLQADKLGMSIVQSSSELPPPLFRQLKADLHIGSGSLSWKASGDMQAVGNLLTSGDIPWLFSLSPFAFEAAKGEGGQVRLAARLADLAALQPWVERMNPLSGKASLNLLVEQPLGTYRISGDGDFDIPTLGIPELGVDLSGKGGISWKGDAGKVDVRLVSGQGYLQSTGMFSLAEKRFPDVVFRHFPLMNTPDQQLVVDGTLAARNKGGNLWLIGELTADPLVVVLPEMQPRVTQDLVWEEPEHAETRFENLRRTRLDVGLNLAGHGLVTGRGMRLQLGGVLRLGGSVAYPRLTGDLKIISGGIDYRNIHLDVLPDSHVTFTGDPERPLLHVRAGRKVDDKLVGVSIDGSADRPLAELFSEPVMPQAEILSYLATGRPLASLGQNGASDAMSLAGFLLGPGSAMQTVQDKVQQSLGLDELAVQTGTKSNSVAAAKRIGERATLRLEEVVTTQASTAVTLEYKLLNSLSVFARKVQNLAPIVGLKLSREWQGDQHQAAAVDEPSNPAKNGP